MSYFLGVRRFDQNLLPSKQTEMGNKVFPNDVLNTIGTNKNVTFRGSPVGETKSDDIVLTEVDLLQLLGSMHPM